jgi:hypothetical protein
MPTPSPLRTSDRQIEGIAAVGRLAHGRTPYGASLALGSALHLRLHRTSPRGHAGFFAGEGPVLRPDALVLR